MKRGNLLWTGSRMMLTEHRQLLNERIRNNNNGYELGREPDEQDQEEWQELWEEAIANQLKVIIIYINHTRKQVEGLIRTWDQQAIYLQQGEEDCIKIPFKKIIDLKLA